MIPYIHNRKHVFALLHIAAWIFVFLLPLYFFNSEWARNSSFLGRYYITAIIYGFVFYFNYFFLVPKFYFSNRRINYFIIITLLIVILYFVEGYLSGRIFRETNTELEIQSILRHYAAQHNLSKPPFGQMHVFNFVLVCILISGFSIGLRVSEKFIQQEKHQKELEKVRLSTELAFLKNQISPHFFFNTLNNIYSLIGVNADDAQEAVLKLSRLMRYLLYESDQDKVRLEKEIEFMNNYIDLMKLRLSGKVDLHVSFPEKVNGIMIPPLIFIPFIENAFKYGISYKERSFIHLTLSVKDQDLLFMCSNSKVDTMDKDDNQFSGIGLDNVTKRLNLLFPKHHNLNLTESDTAYNVQLTINSPEQK